jgi:hypothetical protein
VRLLETVHRNIAAADPVGARRGQEHDDICNLFGGAEAAHRKAMLDVVLEIPRIGEAVAVPAIALDQDRARGHGVDADAMRTSARFKERIVAGAELSSSTSISARKSTNTATLLG